MTTDKGRARRKPPPPADAQPELTVAVVVKDRKDWMARCLAAIDAQDGADFDVLVVDNGSVDGTYEYLVDASSDPSRKRRLTVTQCLGPLGHARNAALQAATGPVVAFTDSDCAPRPGWLAAGMSQFGDRVGVVQGQTVPMRSPHQWDATIRIPAFSHRYETCNIFFDRVALVEAGGFDDDSPHFGDDMAAGWRLRRAGWDARWAPDAIVEHEVTPQGLGWWIQRRMRYECWPRLVQEFPEAREPMLYKAYFLNRRHPLLLLTIAGVIAAIALMSPWPMVAAAPLLWRWRPRGASRRAFRNSFFGLTLDFVGLLALIKGSIQTRTIVL